MTIADWLVLTGLSWENQRKTHDMSSLLQFGTGNNEDSCGIPTLSEAIAQLAASIGFESTLTNSELSSLIAQHV